MALSTTLALSQSLHLPAAVEHRAQVLCCKNGGLGLQMKTLALPQVKLTICNLGQLNGHGRPWALKKRGYVVTCAVDDNGSTSSDGAASSDDEVVTPGAGGAAGTVDSNFKSRRDMLLEYVKNVQPDYMERFVQKAPTQVVDAMRQTVTNMLGTLPPQFFDIHVSTVAENLAQLMYSVMMTGYMFRNAQYRMELQQSLAQAALPEAVSSNATSDSRYAPGTQKTRVSGEVVRWRDNEGPERVDAVEYIELLEAEVEELRKQLELRGRGKNDLLEYLKSLQPQNIQELTTSAGEDALEAMNTFVARLIGVADPTQIKRAATQTTAAELARILYWLMVVGYSIRNIEVRYDMERVLGMPAKLAELPPGETL